MNPLVDTSQEELYLRRYVEAASAVAREPVISAMPFFRRGLYTNMLLGRLGLIPYLLGRARAKAQADGLPQNFMLVVTPTKVRAFKYKAHGRRRDRYEVGEEVAVWDRDAIRVTWQKGGPYMTDVTIESPADEEKVLCRVGHAASSDRFLRLMSDPTATS
jgi:hypothetical protein